MRFKFLLTIAVCSLAGCEAKSVSLLDGRWSPVEVGCASQIYVNFNGTTATTSGPWKNAAMRNATFLQLVRAPQKADGDRGMFTAKNVVFAGDTNNYQFMYTPTRITLISIDVNGVTLDRTRLEKTFKSLDFEKCS